MKKIIEAIVCMSIILSGVAFADTYQFELKAGRSSVEARFNILKDIDHGLLITGIGGMYDDNNYKIADMEVALGSEMFIPGLKCAFGFKGLLGEIEFDNIDGDLMAVGFLLSIVYDIPKIVTIIPLQIFAEATAAPEPLCFIDSERYVETRTGIGINVLENAAVIVEYKHINIHFNKDVANLKMSDDAIFIGYRLRF